MNHLTWTKMNQLQCCAKLSEGISTFCVESYCNEFKSVLESCVSRGAGSVLLKFSSSWLGAWRYLMVGWVGSWKILSAFCPFWILWVPDLVMCPWECYVRYSSISNAARVNFTDCYVRNLKIESPPIWCYLAELVWFYLRDHPSYMDLGTSHLLACAPFFCKIIPPLFLSTHHRNNTLWRGSHKSRSITAILHR